MVKKIKLFGPICLLFSGIILYSQINTAFAQDVSQRSHFKKVVTIVFENTDYNKALKTAYFSELAHSGALFTDFHGETHPSQGNYIALTSGDTYGIFNDFPITLDVRHIGDLLEEKALSWKVYAEQYPENCFLGSKNKGYVRKHVPFMSYKNIQENPERCARIVNAQQFFNDINNNQLPDYSFYVPDLKNSGHDTGVEYASHWFSQTFSPLFHSSQLMKDTLFIITFDEENGLGDDNIYTVLLGSNIKPETKIDSHHNHYSLLKLIEDEWKLGNLGKNDASAPAIIGLW